MNKLKIFIGCVMVLGCMGCDNTNTGEYMGDFLDGLPNPDKIENFDLPDDYGVDRLETFYIDINGNGAPDIIKRGHFFTGTAHSYNFYEIYLDTGEQIADLKTHQGADCVLVAYKFDFNPFVVRVASRSVGDDYSQPTKAKVETLEISGNKLKTVSSKNRGAVCDVRYLL